MVDLSISSWECASTFMNSLAQRCALKAIAAEFWSCNKLAIAPPPLRSRAGRDCNLTVPFKGSSESRLASSIRSSSVQRAPSRSLRGAGSGYLKRWSPLPILLCSFSILHSLSYLVQKIAGAANMSYTPHLNQYHEVMRWIDTDPEDIKLLLSQLQMVLIMSGAGISTSAGIPVSPSLCRLSPVVDINITSGILTGCRISDGKKVCITEVRSLISWPSLAQKVEIKYRIPPSHYISWQKLVSLQILIDFLLNYTMLASYWKLIYKISIY